ncbi:MAG: hypothetical protein ACQESF_04825 [Nanobdellota archaeon]
MSMLKMYFKPRTVVSMEQGYNPEHSSGCSKNPKDFCYFTPIQISLEIFNNLLSKEKRKASNAL